MGERGSARLGIGIAVVFLAILAALAVPMVFRQADRAHEAKAQTTLSKLAREVEACRAMTESYRDCDEPGELERDRSVHWGRGAGGAGVLASRSGEGTFVAYVVAGSGKRVFVWASKDHQVDRWTCRHGSVARLERDGCDGPSW